MPTPTTRRLVLAVLAGLTLLMGALTGTAEHEVRHLPPVPGEVWRPFEPPGSAYGPGHRGVDLGAEPGETVHASAEGVVVHAGAVAGTTWVSIDHVDGLRTAYGPLTSLRVAAGQHVGAAEVIGALAPGGHGHQRRDRGLHFSVRRDGEYLDPLLLFGRGAPSLHGPGGTAPLPDPPGTTTDRPHRSGLGVATPEDRWRSRPAPRDRRAVPGPPTPPASTRHERRWTPSAPGRYPSRRAHHIGGPIVTSITHVR